MAACSCNDAGSSTFRLSSMTPANLSPDEMRHLDLWENTLSEKIEHDFHFSQADKERITALVIIRLNEMADSRELFQRSGISIHSAFLLAVDRYLVKYVLLFESLLKKNRL
jgi:hypothetical protein